MPAGPHYQLQWDVTGTSSSRAMTDSLHYTNPARLKKKRKKKYYFFIYLFDLTDPSYEGSMTRLSLNAG